MVSNVPETSTYFPVTWQHPTLLEKQSKFPRYNMKCRGKHHTTGNFPRSPLDFMLYRRKYSILYTVYCTAHSVQSTVHGYRSLYCTVQEKPETRKQCNISHLYSVFVRLGSLNRYWRWLKSAIQQGPLQYFVAYRAAAESYIYKLLYNLRKF